MVKKILFVFYVPSGGVETLNRQRTAALKNAGIECHSLYYYQRKKRNESNGKLFVTRDPEQIKKIVHQEKYDAIVVVSDYTIFPILRRAGFKGKLILEIQGLGSREKARRFLTAGTTSIGKYADGLLYPKTPMIGQLLGHFFPAKPTFKFNNCFDTSQFTYRQTKASPHPIMAWIGRLVDNKNWEEFLWIGYRLIRQVEPNLQLYMFDDPTLAEKDEQAKFQRLVKQLNLHNHLTLFHNIPNLHMAHYFSMIGDSGGFYCMTSRTEGAPYSVLESLSCRCPVLTTDSGGVRSAIIHNETGKYYKIGNIQDAVKQAVELMKDARQREHIRSRGLHHVKTNFNPAQYTRHFLKMLADLGVN